MRVETRGCWSAGRWGQSGFLSVPVGLPVDDQLERGGGEPIDRRLGEELVTEERQPLIWKWHTFDFGNSA